ncbi:MAG: protein-disulfide reductase DsbD domain-containing protein, partial [Candidatus Tectomicrobia bacterium]
DVAYLIVRIKDSQDGAMPAGNSLAVRALHGLATMGLPRFAEWTRKVLRFYSPTLRERPDTLPYMLWAMSEYYRDAPTLLDVDRRPRETADVVRVAARVVARTDGAMAHRLLVALHIEDGWHVNANPATFDYLIATTITAGDGPELAFAYPRGKALATPLGPIQVYDHAVEIGAPLPTGDTSGIRLAARVQACNDSGICLLPNTISLTLAY